MLVLKHRIVHLDLKGAPLKVSYLEKVIDTFKLWGATGVLLEWEDTFPYSGELAEIGSVKNAGGDNMYSPAEVQHILQFIEDNGLDAIQLIQTIGHMEFVLKHPMFQDLRELPKSPAVLCPTKPRSQMLVREMIDQALDAQPNAKYFHIGADEVWHMGICAQCQEKASSNKHKAAALFLDHVLDLVLYIKEKRPHITVLMWDDMLRNIPLTVLQDYKFGELVLPVIWDYSPLNCFPEKENLIATYAQLFPELLFGTAFKGASGSCQIVPQISRHISNHKAWIALVRSYDDRMNFGGAILTGWSRYDHYATLCELLPVALPSLAVCLKVLMGDWNILEDDTRNEVLPSKDWPGEELARCTQAFVIARERYQSLSSSDVVKTWLNPWQVSRKFTTPGHVEGILMAAQYSLSELMALKADMTTFLQQITGKRSTEEWILSNIEPMIMKATKLHDIARERSLGEASLKPLDVE